MNPVLVAIVLAICAGAVTAVSSRDSGAAAIGLHLFAPEMMHHLGHMLHGGR